MKRKLEDKELAMAIKGVEGKKQELEWLDYQLEYHDLMLNVGLEMNYKKNVRDFKANKRKFENEKKMVVETIKILEDQIRNGVEIKEKEE